ncbi:MAG TPA: RICIN domain-containing protein, partial [Candidatus Paceibacterota bacterium]|nr:RICIN domain-containing protein [Candidatus Paceibacterota bacterium]
MNKKTSMLHCSSGLLATVLAGFVLLAASPAQAVWKTLIDGTSFNSAGAFANAWSYDYPWGNTHNGSARMYSTNFTFSGGVVTIQSVPVSGQGSIHYYSGTFYLKTNVTVDAQHPVWDISVQAQVPTAVGTWPAFWLTGALGWPPESDIMEFKGSSTCWQNTYNGSWASTGTAVSSAGSWHTYRLVAVMINSTTVDFHYYIDGTLRATHTQTGFVGQPMWVIYDYQMEGSSGSPGPTTRTTTAVRNAVIKYEDVSGIPAGPIANGTYKLISRNSGLALDVTNTIPTQPSYLDQFGYWGGVNQQWTMTHLGNNVYSIISRYSGRCADVYGASTADGARIGAWDYLAQNNQQWTATATSGGYYTLKAVNSGKMMDVSGGSTSPGASIIQWTSNGGNNQQW